MQRVHPLVTLEIQIAKTVQTEKIENRLFGNGMVVLGLATSHDENIGLMQVRPAGQAGYPISLVASLDTVPVKCCVPLQFEMMQKMSCITALEKVEV